MRYLTKKNVVLLICLLVLVFVVTAQATVVRQYAFPERYVQQEQTLLANDWPDAACVGKNKVKMRNGGVGYRFIECSAELGNPATTWWFYISSDGRVHSQARFVSA